MTLVRPPSAPPDTGAATTDVPRPARPAAALVVAAGTALLAVLVLALVVGGSLPARVAPAGSTAVGGDVRLTVLAGEVEPPIADLSAPDAFRPGTGGEAAQLAVVPLPLAAP